MDGLMDAIDSTIDRIALPLLQLIKAYKQNMGKP